jgi:sugar fermentation stimulation protein A
MTSTEPTIKYENTVPGIFVRRLNRFAAEVVIDGKTEKVHIKNTGRLRELLLPGAKVTLQKVSDPGRKTAYDLISVYKAGLEWVNIDSLVPNKLMKQYLTSSDYDVVKPEFTFGNSRFDFYMERDGEKYLTEVKGCTLAANLERGIGLFPDAPTERGVKHLDELASAAKKGYHCQVAFVIQMNGIHTVLPNDETHPEFGQALRRAAKAGVQVAFYGCHVEADSIRIIDVIVNNQNEKVINQVEKNEELTLLEDVAAYVQELFRTNAGGHDADHTMRVYRNTLRIAENEPDCDVRIAALAALLHDADDHKLFNTKNNANARAFLEAHQVTLQTIDRICGVINSVSFKQNKGKAPDTPEGKVVQDADRLDAMGAIGVARTFAYGGEHGRSMADSVQHFYDKLLRLKEHMNTETGRQMAEQRHAFLEAFLKEYFEEEGAK